MMSETRATWEERDFYDYAHMTPHGTRKVGRHLADWFIRNRLFP